ncbi:MAG TPA: flavodoxin-dependent (E)-4-hydroxy-3-methylbut-2-enyl-diphosphate synthase [Candidatus Omnitrophota bacterium]|nr:flavodoxin-dependent (E)-4-hydroxy-3-methylbut-2-enyl-diphosphate synthase [Candidatus Omnitrophota bacterium]HPB67925.1 flavodoxin-dependent (E)-4-hydroxy-3-methylbut-2-enyl-diphosphate synthase [Candidatus Omnitrophota bacterium]HQO59230.1 flavodoxin-dependent (E)-4-hydroxy-3-methylbut-2-enyl-diphosphate synthase [Candidatus Omnitrophota bacterium]
MTKTSRRKSPPVRVGDIILGGGRPIVVQTMTDTPTADQEATLAQTRELVEAGAELVRWTINDDDAAQAAPKIIQRLRDAGYTTPIIGDFHYNGHLLLSRFPDLARSLAKYRINPGNMGKGKTHDENFRTCVKIAIDHDKPVRIGVNSGSLNQELLARVTARNAKLKNPKPAGEIFLKAIVESALDNAAAAEALGLKKDKIVLSVKMSDLPDMVKAYETLAKKCPYALHLGLTEAGAGLEGIIASTAGLAVLLEQGIGDTIRVSLTPQPGRPRTEEVRVCRILLQSLGLRLFTPKVVSCPGCGRTRSDDYQRLARKVKGFIHDHMPEWKTAYPGVEAMTVAVMGCVVNGPGESRHADIGISLPGATEKDVAPVYIKGKPFKILKGPGMEEEFCRILADYIARAYGT